MRAFWTACCLLIVAAVPAQAQVDQLIRDLQTGGADARRAAARQLGQSGEEAKKAIPALVKALRSDADTYVRRFSAQSLGAIGAARGVVPALTAALEDKNSSVVTAAAAALGQMGKAGVKPLIDIVENRKASTTTKRRAIVSLGKIGPMAKDGVPALIEALKDRNVRLDAAEALGNIGPNAKAALDTFKTMLEDRRIRRDRSFANVLRTAMRKVQK